MPTWLEPFSVIVLAATPIIELRGAIPLALFQYELNPWTAYALAVFGNLLPVPILFLGLSWLIQWVERFPVLKRPLDWWQERTHRKHSDTFKRFGALALILFVAIPLPATGAWTGSLAAVLFAIPFRIALPLITVGVLIAGAIMTLASLGILAIQ
jgi:uncharacterized membrane protein